MGLKSGRDGGWGDGGEPLSAEVFDEGNEFVELEGFEEKAVGTEGTSQADVALDFGASQDDDGEVMEFGLTADPAEDIEAAGLGKAQVHEEKGRKVAGFGLGEEIEGGGGIIKGFEAVRDSSVFASCLKEEGKIAIIFYQQNIWHVVHHSFAQSLI